MGRRGLEPISQIGAFNEFSQAAFLRGTDSPPSLSLTAESPERTTEKKIGTVISANKKKTAGPPPELNFRCPDCKKSSKGNFLYYTNSASYGNCASCGSFQNLTAAQLALKMGYGEGVLNSQKSIVSGLRTQGQRFKAEIQMDRILDRLVEGQSLGKLYNPHAVYVRTREKQIEWMCNLCGELDH